MVTLTYNGANYFRQRLICSTLSGKPVRIDNIRSKDPKPGLREKLTKGTVIQINKDGTALKYKPGVICGSPYLSHDCPPSRGIGYFMEGILCLAPFGKQPTTITLTGVTNHPKDLSVDSFRNATLFLVELFGISGCTLQVIKRGAPPLGGGEVKLSVPMVKQLNPVQVIDEGMIKRVRGIAYSTRVSPQTSNRIVEGARSILNNFIPDVWVFTDHYTGKKTGLSPGFACYLQAETDTNCRISVEFTGEAGSVPEEIGKHCAKLLCEEVKKGGCIDSNNQWLVFLLMSITPEDVSKVRVGKLTEYSIQYLRHIRDFIGTTFKIKPDYDTSTVVLSCVGSGFKNISRVSN